jgi:multiple sugar transport system ATP-binding protein
MSVHDNLAFGLKARHQTKSVIEEKVNRIAETLHIDRLLDRKPAELSGGERQRVAIGRALVRNPKVYLMDEPLSNLDAKLRTEMRAEIKRIHQEFGTTTVFVTHDQAEAMSLADRLVVMNNGSIIQIGAPIEVYDHPINTFVAQFIGNPSMNLIRGEIKQDNGSLRFDNGVIAFSLLREKARAIKDSALAGDGAVLLGIRPEHMWVSLQKDDAPNQCAADTILVEPLGAQSLVLARVGNDEVRVITDSRLRIKSNDRVFLNFNIEDTNLFRASSGETLGVN